MKQLDSGIWVFDSGYRGECPKEETDQMGYGTWMQSRFPDVLWFHVPNETGTSSRIQFVLKRQKMGVKTGIGDNVIMTPGLKHSCGMIESKRRDKSKSRVSKEQSTVLTEMCRLGHYAAIAYGLDELKKATLFYFGLPFDVD